MGSNILILMEDALRYDAYYGKEMQPLRDFLGPVEEYSRWYTVNNCSDPSIATMLTGMYPWEHKVRYMGQSLLQQRTLFGAFRTRGYLTLFSGWGRHKVIRGMDWDMSIWFPGHIANVRARITPNLQSMMCGISSTAAWFAFVRHMWCHAKYVDGSSNARGYAQSVAATAQDLIGLIAWVRARFPDTIVMITADHGEMLYTGMKGRRRRCTDTIDAPRTPPQHAWGLFEPQVHVPMVVSYPDRREVIHPGIFQHTQLGELALGRTIYPLRHALMEGTGVDRKYAEWYHRGVVDEDVKLILGGKDGAQDPLLYFCNAVGIDETSNQAQAYPEVVATLTGFMPPHVAYTRAEEQVVLERLEALGYGE